MKTASYRIEGTSPLLMHNDRLANPFDDFTKAIKAISGKRKKTEDDLHEMARLEFLGGVYESQASGIHVPGFNVFAMLKSAAKLRKLGASVNRAVIVEEDEIPLEFPDKGKTAAELYKNRAYVDMRTIKNGPTSGRVVRCRPIFRDWSLSFTLAFDERAIQRSDLDMVLEDAGAMIGLGDYRPRFGRFEVAAGAKQ